MVTYDPTTDRMYKMLLLARASSSIASIFTLPRYSCSADDLDLFFLQAIKWLRQRIQDCTSIIIDYCSATFRDENALCDTLRIS